MLQAVRRCRRWASAPSAARLVLYLFTLQRILYKQWWIIKKILKYENITSLLFVVKQPCRYPWPSTRTKCSWCWTPRCSSGSPCPRSLLNLQKWDQPQIRLFTWPDTTVLTPTRLIQPLGNWFLLLVLYVCLFLPSSAPVGNFKFQVQVVCSMFWLYGFFGTLISKYSGMRGKNHKVVVLYNISL